MYRVSPFLRNFGWSLLAGAVLATLWVNLSPATYYDSIEFRLTDLPLPQASLDGAITIPDDGRGINVYVRTSVADAQHALDRFLPGIAHAHDATLGVHA